MSIGHGDIQIAVNIQNQEKVWRLTDDLKNQQQAIQRLDAAYRQAGLSQQQFLQAAAPYAQNIRQITRDLDALKGADLGQAAHRGAMGWMMLSQTIDDAQYGFRSIVNNIPLMAAAMAQSLGMGTDSALKLGGALGIAAVAINTWVQHWEEAKAVFGDTEAFQAAEGMLQKMGNRMREMVASAANLMPAWNFRGEDLARDEARQAKNKEDEADEAKRIEKSRQKIRGMDTEDQKRRAKEFQKGLAEFEGEDHERLRKRLIENSIRGIADPRQRAEFRRAVEDVELGVAPQGETAKKYHELAKKRLKNIDTFIANAMEGKANDADIARAAPEIAKNIKDARAKKEQDIDEQMQEHDAREAKKWLHDKAAKDKRDQRKALTDDHRQKMRSLEDSKELFQEDAERLREGKSKPFKGSYFEYATSHGEAYGEKKNLEELKAIKMSIKDVEKAIKEERRKHEDAMAKLAE